MVVLCLLSVAAFAAGNAKYVFLFIGDGMATPQIAAAEAFLGETTE